MTENSVIDLIWKRCEAAGSQKAWAREAGVSAAYVGDVLRGRRAPGDSILVALGIERVVSYRKVGERG